MKKIFLTTVIILIIPLLMKSQDIIKYPVTKKVDTIDTYFGTKVPDPYRWLEDDTSAATSNWVKEENAVTEKYFEKIPFRNILKERLTKIWNYPKFDVPFKGGTKYFFYKNDGMQNQSVLYIQDALDKEPRVMLDPNKLSTDGTVALAELSVSNNGKYLVYYTSTGGSDWNEGYVIDIENNKLLTDHLKWIKFSGIAWKGDGFYYSRYDEPEKGKELSQKNEFQKMYYHKIGDEQSNDILIYSNKDNAERNYGAQTTEDEKFLIMSETETTSGNGLYYLRLDKNEKEFKQIAKGFDFDYGVIDDYNDKLIMITNCHAPKYKLVLVDPEKPEEKNWVTIIPEKTEVLQGVSYVGGKLIAEYLKDAYSKSYIYTLDGKLEGEVQYPCIGSAGGFSGKKEDNIAFYSFTSFTFPATIYKFDVSANKSTVYKKPEIDFNAENFETKQVFYTSKDGTKIPMFLIYKKGIVLNGNNPTLLYGYGGFNISLTPSFSLSRLLFIENGGIYAMANIRGGGEYGEDWHMAGTKMKKQNVFDDFIYAAQYLIDNKFTSSEKLAIMGGSNGGLLIGACMTQRPDLFKVCIPQVGVMDMLRYQKFTIGKAWSSDYGTSEDSPEMFKYIYGYSPLHNIKAGVKYPATLVMTADHDDRVVPAHSFKFISTLQEKQTGINPVLIRIESMAGHGAGKPTSKIINEYSDLYSFIMFNLGMNPKY
ncbi:MAG TPA: prolyl oligopeptidase family serine peptidase [Bacteroidales bacterium]|nr:prolyl oligopeptidase family serine peptidase [Bacteroidales bacterium]HPS18058.1 prolyl oligopeptidase family serine peptidase [Bacteroidales bacterium]